MPLEGWAEFEAMARRLEENWNEKKREQLLKCGRILQAEIKKKITEVGAVDTGNLRAQWYVRNIGTDTVSVYTNVEYARYVNDGHRQETRFVPGVWRGDGSFNYLPYPQNNGQGFMLRAQFIQGRKFLEKAMYSAKPKVDASLNAFMEEIRREWNST